MKYSVVTGIFLCSVVGSYSQKPPTTQETLAFLRKNITVQYIAKPNADNSPIATIDPESVAKNTNGIVFGTKSNNKMEIGAQFLISLFQDDKDKDFNSSQLQLLANLVMLISSKPFTIAFVNDAVDPIQPKYVPQYRFDTIQAIPGWLTVWPAVFAPDDPKSAGTIIVGEKLFRDLKEFQIVFLNLVTCMYVKEFGSYSFFATHETPQASAFAANPVLRRKIKYCFPNPDTRKTVNLGIATGVTYMIADAYKKDAAQWFGEPDIVIRTRVESGKASGPGVSSIPDNVQLKNIIDKDNLADKGYDLVSPPFEPHPSFSYGKGFRLQDLGPKYIIRNEVSLGLFSIFFLNNLGVGEFLNVVTFNNNRLLNAAPENRLAIFIENLCLMLLNGQTLADVKAKPPQKKGYLLGLAMFDLFTGYIPNANAALFNQLAGGTISPDLMALYFGEIRNTCMEAAKNTKTYADLSLVEVQVVSIKRMLGMQ
ncbi:MAG TPA: hypothetical protein VLJ68_00130 [Chitinophagaceae bacterium]|nr:hypothetical protein [Chitinophagaceae bacterium]